MATLWAAITLVGFWGFVVGTIGLILKGFPARGVFDGKASLKWGGALLLCFAVWIVGMNNA